MFKAARFHSGANLTGVILQVPVALVQSITVILSLHFIIFVPLFITTPQYMYIRLIGYCSVEYTGLVHIKNVRSFVSICCKVTFEHLNFLISFTRSTSPPSPCNHTELRILYRQRHRQNHPSDALKLEIPSLFASYSALS